ncbi:hypothetical protein ACRTEU_24690, partial [Vibrio alginolyticus]|uniref:hypothetical protein n=1 Tax=Vibrio alginolyticus TaxID=663 RepID=UPI003D7E730C
PPPPHPLFQHKTAYEIWNASRGLGDVYKRQVQRGMVAHAGFHDGSSWLYMVGVITQSNVSS